MFSFGDLGALLELGTIAWGARMLPLDGME